MSDPDEGLVSTPDQCFARIGQTSTSGFCFRQVRVNVGRAETDLSKLLARVEAGERSRSQLSFSVVDARIPDYDVPVMDAGT